MSRSTPIEARPLIERIRSKHEEIEKMEQLIMKYLESEPLSRREQLVQGHLLRNMTESIIDKTEELVETYAAFTDEMESLDDQTETWKNVCGDFSYRLKQIHEYYEKHPSSLINTDEGYEALLNEELVLAFSSEEGFGRYLDLHDMYNQYIESNLGERVEYSAYLDVFSQPDKIPRELKLSWQYREYMEALLEYLISFFKRTEPLQDLDRILYEDAGGKVRRRWNHGHDNELITFHHTEEMGALGLKTTGEVQGAERLFQITSVMEAQVKKLCNLLDETIERTKQKEGEKKRAFLAYEENPLKHEAIMGWDGKPIPYWLCKLGLGKEYKCEICNNYSYSGKGAFKRHFKEWHHQASLRRLGIPDIEEKKFCGITSIEETEKVWEKMKGRAVTLADWKFEGIKDEKAPVGVAIPPPNIRRKVERIALIVSRKGLEHEKTIIDIWGEDEDLNFLKSSDDPYHAFYQHKLTEYRAGKNQEIRTGSLGYFPEDEEQISRVPALRLEADKFTCRVPRGMMITRKELEIIKLTAEFLVRYGGGGCYLEGLSSDHPHELEFINNKSDGKFSIFSELVSAYGKVISSRPKVVKENLRENAADIETVLENCYQRLQLHRFYKERKPVLKNRYYQRLMSNRFYLDKYWERKIGESGLFPEKEFLAQHPGMAAIGCSYSQSDAGSTSSAPSPA